MHLFRRAPDKSARRAVIIVARLPDYATSAENPRLAARVLTELGYEVTILAREALAGDWFVAEMKQASIETYIVRGSLTGTTLLAEPDRWVEKAKFDLAFVFAWNPANAFLPALRKGNPACHVIISTVDLAFLRLARRDTHREAGQLRPNPISEMTSRRMMQELNVYAQCDAVIAVSQFEADVIEAMLSNPGITSCVAWQVSAEAASVPRAARHGLLLVGNFGRDPNVSAAHYFFEQIVPLLDPARLANHPIRIVGKSAKQELAAFANCPHVDMVGEVPRLQPYYEQALVNIVPLLYGAGIKQKIVEASLTGLPTITTSIGVEGLPLRRGEDVLVADSPRDFADAIHRLMDDATLWERLAVGARTRISAAYDSEGARAALRGVILKATGE